MSTARACLRKQERSCAGEREGARAALHSAAGGRTHALLRARGERGEALGQRELEPQRAQADRGALAGAAAKEQRRVHDGPRPREVVRVRGRGGGAEATVGRDGPGRRRRGGGGRGGRRGGRGRGGGGRGSAGARRRRGDGAELHLQRAADERHAADAHGARAALGQEARRDPAGHPARGRGDVERVVSAVLVARGAVVEGGGLELADDGGALVRLVGRRLGRGRLVDRQRRDARAQLRRERAELALGRVEQRVAPGLVLRREGGERK